MAEKILNTRILHKIDTLENWGKSPLKIKQGEICFATVAASAGTGLTEPVVMVKVGTDEEKTFSELPWSFYAKASDVLEVAKDASKLTEFVNNVIADAGIASSDAMDALAKRVTTVEGDITTLKGDENTAGSVAKEIKDAIDALDLDNTFVAQEDGKSLVSDTEITKLAGVSEGANKVEASTNGNIKIDGVDTVVYVHPDKHAIADVDGLQGVLDGKAEKATTLAGYNIGDAYTKTEVDSEIEGAINTFVSAYITSDGGAIDKLQEIADWIDSDKNGTADIIANIEANTSGIENLGERMDVAEDAIEAIDNHSHTNKTVLDGVTAEKVAAWDAAEQNAKDYADGQVNGLANGAVKQNTDAIAAINHETDGILAQAKAYADALNHEDTTYTAAADGGLKLDENNAFSIDDTVTFIFDCGDAGVTNA